ncbi:hypothetical protein HYC85_028965 [Camellia sinensis]|uniref:Uncharacterized protein n=1 Tax=Camellia sinensis TaxID=4442 RepID=A0A7J7G0K1_CAMSI|nr:hypothetical protein HYC85_028965 [Camellia sinensis]
MVTVTSFPRVDIINVKLIGQSKHIFIRLQMTLSVSQFHRSALGLRGSHIHDSL